jgi:MoaA/NifB/PqqE/SkfB family radical SAM enzyme
VHIRCLGLELTDRCDLACAHCLRQVVPPRSWRARDLDFDLALRLCGEARALAVPHVALTGGEPMLHPGFSEIVDGLLAHGLTYHFLSNGLGLPERLPALLAVPARRAGLRDICVSLDGATESTHDRTRGTGTFRRTLAGIAVARAMGVPVSLLMTVTRVNRHEIDAMGLLAHHLGAAKLYFTHFMPNGRPGASADLDLTTAERHQVEAVIKRLIAALRLPIFMGEGYYASEVDHQCATVQGAILNVDPEGHLTFCCELSNYYGDERPPADRDDFIADLAVTPLAEAVTRYDIAIARFRAARLADERAGLRTEDDRFACRYCIRHFGKPEASVVPTARLKRATGT